jgi:hypothetical protein
LYNDAMLIIFFHARHLNRFSLMSQWVQGAFVIIFARIFQAICYEWIFETDS